MDVSFETPTAFLGLWLLVPVAWLVWYGRRRRQRALRALLGDTMRDRLAPSRPASRAVARALLLCGAFALLVLAWARPRWGVSFEQITARGADVMVVLDVSRSMESTDLVPSRLGRARQDVLDLLTHLKGDRIGLVSFAGAAVVSCPLTLDQAFFRSVLEQVGPQTAPLGGTAIGAALRTALEAMERTADRDQAILLITDGEDHDSDPLGAAQEALARDVKIFTVGLGDPAEGARVPLESKEGQRTYLKHEGQEVWSRMDESLLEKLALTTQGAYVPARTSAYDLGEVYEDHLAQLNSGDLRSDRRRRRHEQYQWFLGLGLGLLLLEMLVTPFQKSRALATAALLLVVAGAPGAHGQTSPDPAPTPAAGAAGPAASNSPPAGATNAAAPQAAGATVADDPTEDAADAGPDHAGARELDGDPEADPVDLVETGLAQLARLENEAALASFEQAQRRAPDDPRVAFDRGVALSALDRFEDAHSAYLDAARTSDPLLAARAQYNIGRLTARRAQLLFGDHPEEATPEVREEGVAQLEDSIRQFRACLDLQPDHEDARHNLELLRLWIKHMESVWAERDRQARRDAMDLLAFVEYLAGAEGDLFARTRFLELAADTPRRRTELKRRAGEQATLLEEMPALDQKIDDAFAEMAAQAAPAPGAPAPGPAAGGQDEAMKQAHAALRELSKQAADHMQGAEVRLRELELDLAADEQRQAYQRLHQLWLALAPFDRTLTAALEGQKQQQKTTEATVDADEEVRNATLPLVDLEEESVAMRADTLPMKGAMMVSQLEAMQNAQAEAAGPATPLPDEEPLRIPPPDDENTVLPPPDPEHEGATLEPPGDGGSAQAAAQLAALREAVAKAEENVPAILEEIQAARDSLAEPDPEAAVPHQAEAARLLQEIADLMPRQENEDDQDGEPQDDSDDSEQDSPQDQDPQNPQDPPQDQNQEQEQPGPQGEETPQPMSPQQIEALLRQAEEREREANEQREKIEAIGLGRRKVEKDW